VKFRNRSADAVEIPALGIVVEPGAEFTADGQAADGLAAQCGPDATFEQVTTSSKPVTTEEN
jgi:hypothetical protein